VYTNQPIASDPIKFYTDPENNAYFAEVGLCYDNIEQIGRTYLADKEHISTSNTDKVQTYTKSTDYFFETMEYHRCPYVQEFNGVALQAMGAFKMHTAVDVGCAWGVTGLVVAEHGIPVTFHDFEGAGLDFLRWTKNNGNLKDKINVVPYGDPIKRHGTCLAFDVLEHTGNHLAALRWFKELGDLVIMCYPTRVPLLEPFKPYGLDEWVDDEAIMWTIQRRYQLIYSSLRYSWRSIVFC
jgi:hypothetical protein